MNKYEIIFILDPTIEDSEVENKFNSLLEILKAQGAEILDSIDWGKRKLAYSIKKKDNGIYRVYRFNAKPMSITEIERRLRIDEQILRSLIVLYDPEAGLSKKTAESKR
ncbi:MAG TPA: 30S ribosomal protein S6 [archaeon]|nr:30S ribosomal protein S6 [archaeon]